jgi:hypothetical protein
MDRATQKWNTNSGWHFCVRKPVFVSDDSTYINSFQMRRLQIANYSKKQAVQRRHRFLQQLPTCFFFTNGLYRLYHLRRSGVGCPAKWGGIIVRPEKLKRRRTYILSENCFKLWNFFMWRCSDMNTLTPCPLLSFLFSSVRNRAVSSLPFNS